MIGEIKDPAGFADCCKTSPDQCTSRYIGDSIESRGAIYHQAEKKAAAQAGATTPIRAGGDMASLTAPRGSAAWSSPIRCSRSRSARPLQPSRAVRLQRLHDHAPAV